jgi:hypothetical protein
MFGGPKGDESPLFLKSKYLDPRIYPSVSFQQLVGFQRAALALDGDRIWRIAAALPEKWKTASALRHFALCLKRLSQTDYLQHLLDMIFCGEQRARQFAPGDFPSELPLATSVLCPRVSDAELDQTWDNPSACAQGGRQESNFPCQTRLAHHRSSGRPRLS